MHEHLSKPHGDPDVTARVPEYLREHLSKPQNDLAQLSERFPEYLREHLSNPQNYTAELPERLPDYLRDHLPTILDGADEQWLIMDGPNNRQDHAPTYDPDDHDKGEWFREQISDDEWNDYEWIEVGGIGGSPTKYIRSFKRR
jgi:hypothetical protein